MGRTKSSATLQVNFSIDPEEVCIVEENLEPELAYQLKLYELNCGFPNYRENQWTILA